MDTNPIGIPQQIFDLEAKVGELLNIWKLENPIQESFWGLFSQAQVSFNKITTFLINSLDQFIQIVDDQLEVGADKKATVMIYIEKLYDEIVTVSLPFYLRPFNVPIKRFVIMVVISGAIDFFVDKYRNGAWRDKWEEISEDAEDGVWGNEENIF